MSHCSRLSLLTRQMVTSKDRVTNSYFSELGMLVVMHVHLALPTDHVTGEVSVVLSVKGLGTTKDHMV